MNLPNKILEILFFINIIFILKFKIKANYKKWYNII